MPVLTPHVPDGLIDLMKALTKSILKEKPENIYEFAVQHFERLIIERDGSLNKGYEIFRSEERYFKSLAKYKKLLRSSQPTESTSTFSQFDQINTDGHAVEADLPPSQSSAQRKFKPRKLSSRKPSEGLISIKEEDDEEGAKVEIDCEMRRREWAAFTIQKAFRKFQGTLQKKDEPARTRMTEEVAALIIQRSLKTMFSNRLKQSKTDAQPSISPTKLQKNGNVQKTTPGDLNTQEVDICIGNIPSIGSPLLRQNSDDQHPSIAFGERCTEDENKQEELNDDSVNQKVDMENNVPVLLEEKDKTVHHETSYETTTKSSLNDDVLNGLPPKNRREDKPMAFDNLEIDEKVNIVAEDSKMENHLNTSLKSEASTAETSVETTSVTEISTTHLPQTDYLDRIEDVHRIVEDVNSARENSITENVSDHENQHEDYPKKDVETGSDTNKDEQSTLLESLPGEESVNISMEKESLASIIKDEKGGKVMVSSESLVHKPQICVDSNINSNASNIKSITETESNVNPQNELYHLDKSPIEKIETEQGHMKLDQEKSPVQLTENENEALTNASKDNPDQVITKQKSDPLLTDQKSIEVNNTESIQNASQTLGEQDDNLHVTSENSTAERDSLMQLLKEQKTFIEEERRNALFPEENQITQRTSNKSEMAQIHSSDTKDLGTEKNTEQSDMPADLSPKNSNNRTSQDIDQTSKESPEVNAKIKIPSIGGVSSEKTNEDSSCEMPFFSSKLETTGSFSNKLDDAGSATTENTAETLTKAGTGLLLAAVPVSAIALAKTTEAVNDIDESKLSASLPQKYESEQNIASSLQPEAGALDSVLAEQNIEEETASKGLSGPHRPNEIIASAQTLHKEEIASEFIDNLDEESQPSFPSSKVSLHEDDINENIDLHLLDETLETLEKLKSEQSNQGHEEQSINIFETKDEHNIIELGRGQIDRNTSSDKSSVKGESYEKDKEVNKLNENVTDDEKLLEMPSDMATIGENMELNNFKSDNITNPLAELLVKSDISENLNKKQEETQPIAIESILPLCEQNALLDTKIKEEKFSDAPSTSIASNLISKDGIEGESTPEITRTISEEEVIQNRVAVKAVENVDVAHSSANPQKPVQSSESTETNSTEIDSTSLKEQSCVITSDQESLVASLRDFKSKSRGNPDEGNAGMQNMETKTVEIKAIEESIVDAAEGNSISQIDESGYEFVMLDRVGNGSNAEGRENSSEVGKNESDEIVKTSSHDKVPHLSSNDNESPTKHKAVTKSNVSQKSVVDQMEEIKLINDDPGSSHVTSPVMSVTIEQIDETSVGKNNRSMTPENQNDESAELSILVFEAGDAKENNAGNSNATGLSDEIGKDEQSKGHYEGKNNELSYDTYKRVELKAVEDKSKASKIGEKSVEASNDLDIISRNTNTMNTVPDMTSCDTMKCDNAKKKGMNQDKCEIKDDKIVEDNIRLAKDDVMRNDMDEQNQDSGPKSSKDDNQKEVFDQDSSEVNINKANKRQSSIEAGTRSEPRDGTSEVTLHNKENDNHDDQQNLTTDEQLYDIRETVIEPLIVKQTTVANGEEIDDRIVSEYDTEKENLIGNEKEQLQRIVSGEIDKNIMSPDEDKAHTNPSENIFVQQENLEKTIGSRKQSTSDLEMVGRTDEVSVDKDSVEHITIATPAGLVQNESVIEKIGDLKVNSKGPVTQLRGIQKAGGKNLDKNVILIANTLCCSETKDISPSDTTLEREYTLDQEIGGNDANLNANQTSPETKSAEATDDPLYIEQSETSSQICAAKESTIVPKSAQELFSSVVDTIDNGKQKPVQSNEPIPLNDESLIKNLEKESSMKPVLAEPHQIQKVGHEQLTASLQMFYDEEKNNSNNELNKIHSTEQRSGAEQNIPASAVFESHSLPSFDIVQLLAEDGMHAENGRNKIDKSDLESSDSDLLASQTPQPTELSLFTKNNSNNPSSSQIKSDDLQEGIEGDTSTKLHDTILEKIANQIITVHHVNLTETSANLNPEVEIMETLTSSCNNALIAQSETAYSSDSFQENSAETIVEKSSEQALKISVPIEQYLKSDVEKTDSEIEDNGATFDTDSTNKEEYAQKRISGESLNLQDESEHNTHENKGEIALTTSKELQDVNILYASILENANTAKTSVSSSPNKQETFNTDIEALSRREDILSEFPKEVGTPQQSIETNVKILTGDDHKSRGTKTDLIGTNGNQTEIQFVHGNKDNNVGNTKSPSPRPHNSGEQNQHSSGTTSQELNVLEKLETENATVVNPLKNDDPNFRDIYEDLETFDENNPTGDSKQEFCGTSEKTLMKTSNITAMFPSTHNITTNINNLQDSLVKFNNPDANVNTQEGNDESRSFEKKQQRIKRDTAMMSQDQSYEFDQDNDADMTSDTFSESNQGTDMLPIEGTEYPSANPNLSGQNEEFEGNESKNVLKSSDMNSLNSDAILRNGTKSEEANLENLKVPSKNLAQIVEEHKENNLYEPGQETLQITETVAGDRKSHDSGQQSLKQVSRKLPTEENDYEHETNEEQKKTFDEIENIHSNSSTNPSKESDETEENLQKLVLIHQETASGLVTDSNFEPKTTFRIQLSPDYSSVPLPEDFVICDKIEAEVDQSSETTQDIFARCEKTNSDMIKQGSTNDDLKDIKFSSDVRNQEEEVKIENIQDVYNKYQTNESSETIPSTSAEVQDLNVFQRKGSEYIESIKSLALSTTTEEIISKVGTAYSPTKNSPSDKLSDDLATYSDPLVITCIESPVNMRTNVDFQRNHELNSTNDVSEDTNANMNAVDDSEPYKNMPHSVDTSPLEHIEKNERKQDISHPEFLKTETEKNAIYSNLKSNVDEELDYKAAIGHPESPRAKVELIKEEIQPVKDSKMESQTDQAKEEMENKVISSRSASAQLQSDSGLKSPSPNHTDKHSTILDDSKTETNTLEACSNEDEFTNKVSSGKDSFETISPDNFANKIDQIQSETLKDIKNQVSKGTSDSKICSNTDDTQYSTVQEPKIAEDDEVEKSTLLEQPTSDIVFDDAIMLDDSTVRKLVLPQSHDSKNNSEVDNSPTIQACEEGTEENENIPMGVGGRTSDANEKRKTFNQLLDNSDDVVPVNPTNVTNFTNELTKERSDATQDELLGRHTTYSMEPPQDCGQYINAEKVSADGGDVMEIHSTPNVSFLTDGKISNMQKTRDQQRKNEEFHRPDENLKAALQHGPEDLHTDKCNAQSDGSLILNTSPENPETPHENKAVDANGTTSGVAADDNVEVQTRCSSEFVESPTKALSAAKEQPRNSELEYKEKLEPFIAKQKTDIRGPSAFLNKLLASTETLLPTDPSGAEDIPSYETHQENVQSDFPKVIAHELTQSNTKINSTSPENSILTNQKFTGENMIDKTGHNNRSNLLTSEENTIIDSKYKIDSKEDAPETISIDNSKELNLEGNKQPTQDTNGSKPQSEQGKLSTLTNENAVLCFPQEEQYYQLSRTDSASALEEPRTMLQIQSSPPENIPVNTDETFPLAYQQEQPVNLKQIGSIQNVEKAATKSESNILLSGTTLEKSPIKEYEKTKNEEPRSDLNPSTEPSTHLQLSTPSTENARKLISVQENASTLISKGEDLSKLSSDDLEYVDSTKCTHGDQSYTPNINEKINDSIESRKANINQNSLHDIVIPDLDSQQTNRQQDTEQLAETFTAPVGKDSCGFEAQDVDHKIGSIETHDECFEKVVTETEDPARPKLYRSIAMLGKVPDHLENENEPSSSIASKRERPEEDADDDNHSSIHDSVRERYNKWMMLQGNNRTDPELGLDGGSEQNAKLVDVVLSAIDNSKFTDDSLSFADESLEADSQFYDSLSEQSIYKERNLFNQSASSDHTCISRLSTASCIDDPFVLKPPNQEKLQHIENENLSTVKEPTTEILSFSTTENYPDSLEASKEFNHSIEINPNREKETKAEVKSEVIDGKEGLVIREPMATSVEMLSALAENTQSDNSGVDLTRSTIPNDIETGEPMFDYPTKNCDQKAGKTIKEQRANLNDAYFKTTEETTSQNNEIQDTSKIEQTSNESVRTDDEEHQIISPNETCIDNIQFEPEKNKNLADINIPKMANFDPNSCQSQLKDETKESSKVENSEETNTPVTIPVKHEGNVNENSNGQQEDTLNLNSILSAKGSNANTESKNSMCINKAATDDEALNLKAKEGEPLAVHSEILSKKLTVDEEEQDEKLQPTDEKLQTVLQDAPNTLSTGGKNIQSKQLDIFSLPTQYPELQCQAQEKQDIATSSNLSDDTSNIVAKRTSDSTMALSDELLSENAKPDIAEVHGRRYAENLLESHSKQEDITLNKTNSPKKPLIGSNAVDVPDKCSSAQFPIGNPSGDLVDKRKPDDQTSNQNVEQSNIGSQTRHADTNVDSKRSSKTAPALYSSESRNELPVRLDQAAETIQRAFRSYSGAQDIKVDKNGNQPKVDLKPIKSIQILETNNELTKPTSSKGMWYVGDDLIIPTISKENESESKDNEQDLEDDSTHAGLNDIESKSSCGNNVENTEDSTIHSNQTDEIRTQEKQHSPQMLEESSGVEGINSSCSFKDEKIHTIENAHSFQQSEAVEDVTRIEQADSACNVEANHATVCETTKSKQSNLNSKSSDDIEIKAPLDMKSDCLKNPKKMLRKSLSTPCANLKNPKSTIVSLNERSGESKSEENQHSQDPVKLETAAVPTAVSTLAIEGDVPTDDSGIEKKSSVPKMSKLAEYVTDSSDAAIHLQVEMGLPDEVTGEESNVKNYDQDGLIKISQEGSEKKVSAEIGQQDLMLDLKNDRTNSEQERYEDTGPGKEVVKNEGSNFKTKENLEDSSISQAPENTIQGDDDAKKDIFLVSTCDLDQFNESPTPETTETNCDQTFDVKSYQSDSRDSFEKGLDKSREESPQSDVENIDISVYGEDSLEAMYYSLKKHELLLDKMHKKASVRKSASGGREKPVGQSESAKESIDKENNADQQPEHIEEINCAAGRLHALSDESTGTNQHISPQEPDNSSQPVSENNEQNNDTLSPLDPSPPPRKRKLSRNDSYYTACLSRPITSATISPRSRSEHNSENPIELSKQKTEEFIQQLHFDHSLDETTKDEIRRNMLAYSVSEADSDYCEPGERTNAILNDFNISTALEHTPSTDTDSTIVSAVTKIQAGARGFLTRRRLRRASVATTSFSDRRPSFGNEAIGESLEDLIDEEDAARRIQKSFRRYRNRKTRQSAPNLRNDTTEGTSSKSSNGSLDEGIVKIIDVKVEQRPHSSSKPVEDSTEESKQRKQPVDSIHAGDENVLNTNSMDQTKYEPEISLEGVNLATRRMTLQRGDAVQRNSTAESENSSLSGGSSKKSGDSQINKSLPPRARSSGTERRGKNTERNIERAKRFTTRQRSMPVQIDFEILRVLPRHLRKRIKSADQENKEKSNH